MRSKIARMLPDSFLAVLAAEGALLEAGVPDGLALPAFAYDHGNLPQIMEVRGPDSLRAGTMIDTLGSAWTGCG